jgi:hypothetical protein
VDVLTELIGKHGQYLPPSSPGAKPSDTAYLIADGREAFALEASGRYWVYQEVREVRAMSDACTIRQDWNRIAPGLADNAIERGWWQADGSKLDFAGALARHPEGHHAGLRRWARATMLLQEQNGHIDTAFLRRLLADHGEEPENASPGRDAASLCHHSGGPGKISTALSLVAELADSAEHPVLAWVAFGPPCASVYFPLFLEGDVPDAFCHGDDGDSESVGQRMNRLQVRASRDTESQGAIQEGLLRLQARFDHEAEEFVQEAARLRAGADQDSVHRQAGLFMQHVVEQFDEVAFGLLHEQGSRRPAVTSS